MEPIAHAFLDDHHWSITFVGGTADLDETPVALPKATAAQPGVCLPLAMTASGDRVWVVEIRGGRRLVRRLTDLGITPGLEIAVVNCTESGSVIVGLPGCRIGIGAGMAHRVMVTTVQPPQVSRPTASEPSSSDATGSSDMTTTPLTLGVLEVGQSGRILGYESGGRAYRGKLLSMGLTPGTHFTVTRQAPLGDPIEIEVRGFKLSLRKGEAAALQVAAMVGKRVDR
jgi:ferrous iron transport protein A